MTAGTVEQILLNTAYIILKCGLYLDCFAYTGHTAFGKRVPYVETKKISYIILWFKCHWLIQYNQGLTRTAKGITLTPRHDASKASLPHMFIIVFFSI